MVRCSRCGNDNPEGNRFCGMCGASMYLGRGGQGVGQVPPVPEQTAEIPRPQPPGQNPPIQSPPTHGFPAQSVPTIPAPSMRVAAAAPTAPSMRAASPVNPEVTEPAKTVISGPSFLGLDKPGLDKSPAGSNRNSTLGLGAPGRAAGNLDYLLEDDEEPKRGSGKMFFLILVALALALGFGYLRWRSGGMAWLTAGMKKPPAASSDSGPGTDSSSSPGPSSSGSPSSGPTSGTPAAPTADTSQPDGSPSAGNGAGASSPGVSPAPPPASTSSTPNAPDSGNPANTPGAAPPAGPDVNGSSGAPAAKKDSATATKENSDSNSDDSADEDAEDQPSKPAAPVAAKPHAVAKPTPTRPVDSVTEAEKYIYGRGVKQDCERGMRMLRPQAEHSNVKAMSSLGVLYSAGLCTPRDLPTSYRWIALALRKEPDNSALKENLQKLWGEMTQPERQLAIKLSQ